MSRIADHSLIAALSGRVLAQSAAIERTRVGVLDCFADQDTRRYAATCVRVAGTVDGGVMRFDTTALLATAADLFPASQWPCLVYGAGFEPCPDTLEQLAEQRELLGNEPDVLRRITDPVRFFALLDELAIPHPSVRTDRPADPDGWLAKRVGASGGAHVAAAGTVREQSGCYYQRQVVGELVSVLFVANGRDIAVIGFNSLFTAGRVGSNHNAYGGAISRIPVSRQLRAAVMDMLQGLQARLHLRGLNGVDLIVTDTGPVVLELNARPTATVDLYDRGSKTGLLQQHIEACRGGTLRRQSTTGPMWAHAVVRANHAVRISQPVQWPSWCSDIPADLTEFQSGEPICTVLAVSDGLGRSRQRLSERSGRVLRALACGGGARAWRRAPAHLARGGVAPAVGAL